MGKGVVLSNKGTQRGILLFQNTKKSVGSCNENYYSSFKMMNVDCAENDHIKFGA